MPISSFGSLCDQIPPVLRTDGRPARSISATYMRIWDWDVALKILWPRVVTVVHFVSTCARGINDRTVEQTIRFGR